MRTKLIALNKPNVQRTSSLAEESANFDGPRGVAGVGPDIS